MSGRSYLCLVLVQLASIASMAAPALGDTVAVLGASGNVGKLVALRLAENFKVRGVVRDASRVRGFLPPEVDLYEADLRAEDPVLELSEALKDVSCLVVCTGTTAFPTQAWSQSGRDGVAVPVLKALVDARFSVSDAISTLTKDGYNTPQTVDEEGNLRILKAWEAAAGARRKHLVLLSSTGVQRRAEMPFPILNACGVLSAKAAAEAAIQADAAERCRIQLCLNRGSNRGIRTTHTTATLTTPERVDL